MLCCVPAGDRQHKSLPGSQCVQLKACVLSVVSECFKVPCRVSLVQSCVCFCSSPVSRDKHLQALVGLRGRRTRVKRAILPLGCRWSRLPESVEKTFHATWRLVPEDLDAAFHLRNTQCHQRSVHTHSVRHVTRDQNTHKHPEKVE